MPNERVVEVPWALSALPQSGLILDVGSCDATYLLDVHTDDRRLECLDARDCRDTIPSGVRFHHGSLFGNSLPRYHYDAVLLLSVLEHLGLPTYGQPPLPRGDLRGIAECWSLLKPGGALIATLPAGRPKIVSWYRQYSPDMIDRLFAGWRYDVRYWGFVEGRYVEISSDEVTGYSYRDRFDEAAGAGALAAVLARRD